MAWSAISCKIELRLIWRAHFDPEQEGKSFRVHGVTCHRIPPDSSLYHRSERYTLVPWTGSQSRRMQHNMGSMFQVIERRRTGRGERLNLPPSAAFCST